jgi:hypothetical protein
VQGYFNSYAVPGNLDSLRLFRERVLRYWGHRPRKTWRFRLSEVDLDFSRVAEWLLSPWQFLALKEGRILSKGTVSKNTAHKA